MDLFKKKNIEQANFWDWTYPRYTKRAKGDTKKLHRLARKRLKRELKKEVKRIKEEGKNETS